MRILESFTFFMLQELKLGNAIKPAPEFRSKALLCFKRTFWVNNTRSLSSSGGSLLCDDLNLAALFQRNEKIDGGFYGLGGNEQAMVLTEG